MRVGWAGWFMALVLFACTARAQEVADFAAAIAPDRTLTAEQVAAGRLAFTTQSAHTVFPLDARNALWLQLRLPPSGAQAWVLEIPVPVLDAVSLYQQDAAGRWVESRAGDTIPLPAWPEAGRYPFFRLAPSGERAVDLLLQVRHAIPLALPVRVVSTNTHDYRTQLEYLGLGMALGALALMMAGALVRAWKLRDAAYALFAGHVFASGLAVAAFTGVAAQWIWPGAGSWVDAAPGCLAVLSAGISLLVVDRLAMLVIRTRRLGSAVRLAGWLGPLFALLYLALDRRNGIVLLGSYILVVSALGLGAAVVTWRRGDPVGRWMLLGTLPLVFAVLVAVARVYNWVETSWLTEYAVVMALTFDLPTLLAALNSRSRERRGAHLRQQAAASQDPLTGLLKAGPFTARLHQAAERHKARGEGAAVAVIELTNYDWIKSTLGAEQAEECLLRAVIKLRKLVRDIDTTGRIGQARFGLVLEGVNSRSVVTRFATRLIAWGLMPEEETPGAPVLQFHIVALLLDEHAATGEDPLAALVAALRAMSPRTRRTFRFVDPHAVPSQPPLSDGSLETASAQ